MHGNRAAKMNDLKIKFDMPTSWRHGKGIVTQTGKMLAGLGCNRPLLLTDNYLVSAGVVEQVMDSFKKEGITYSMCGDVNKEPTVRLLDEIGLSARLSDFGYKEMHLQTIIKETLGSAQAPTNPRELTESELADIVNKIV